MKYVWLRNLAVLASLSVCGAAQARVTVQIDLAAQRMLVQSSTGSYVWPISSGRSGFSTPGGSFAPTNLVRMHYSRKYNMAPMPYAIFFRGGYAIHGTYETHALGRPASHGCVRLAPGNAAALFAMVQQEGARISITGAPPGNRPDYARRLEPAQRMEDGYGARRVRIYTPYYAGPVYYPAGGGWRYGPPLDENGYGYHPYGY